MTSCFTACIVLFYQLKCVTCKRLLWSDADCEQCNRCSNSFHRTNWLYHVYCSTCIAIMKLSINWTFQWIIVLTPVNILLKIWRRQSALAVKFDLYSVLLHHVYMYLDHCAVKYIYIYTMYTIAWTLHVYCSIYIIDKIRRSSDL